MKKKERVGAVSITLTPSEKERVWAAAAIEDRTLSKFCSMKIMDAVKEIERLKSPKKPKKGQTPEQNRPAKVAFYSLKSPKKNGTK